MTFVGGIFAGGRADALLATAIPLASTVTAARAVAHISLDIGFSLRYLH
jgi:hypothetical protein